MKKILIYLLLILSIVLVGCGDSHHFTPGDFIEPLTPVPSKAPVAADDTYATDFNAVLSIAAPQGVLINDTLNTNRASDITIIFPAATANGGTISGTSNSGGFTYTPPTNFSGNDSFTYTLDNGFARDSATVTITVNASPITAQGYYVDSLNGNDATGAVGIDSPFKTVQAAVAAAPESATIIVLPGTYTGDEIALKDGQRLIGSSSDLVYAQGEVRPTLNCALKLGNANTVDSISFSDISLKAIDGDGSESATITNCEFKNVAGTYPGSSAGIAFSGSGTLTVEHNFFSNIQNGYPIWIEPVDGGNLTAYINKNTIENSDWGGLYVDAFFISSAVKLQVKGNMVEANPSWGSIRVDAFFSSNVTAQILDNKVDTSGSFYFSVYDGTDITSHLFIENYDNLLSINNSQGLITVEGGDPYFKAPENIADAGF